MVRGLAKMLGVGAAVIVVLTLGLWYGGPPSWAANSAQTPPAGTVLLLGPLYCALGSGNWCITTAQVSHGSPAVSSAMILDSKLTAPASPAAGLPPVYDATTLRYQSEPLNARVALEDETIREDKIDTDATDGVDWLAAFGINAGTNVTFRPSVPAGAVYIDAAGGGSGLNTAAVNVLIRAGVFDWAETGNTDLIPRTKLPLATSSASGVIQPAEYIRINNAILGSDLHNTPHLSNAGLETTDAILLDDASVTSGSELKEISIGELDLRWGSSNVAGRLKFVGAVLPGVAGYNSGDLALIPNNGLFQAVSSTIQVSTVSLTGFQPVAITAAGETVYGFNASNGARPAALPSWILSLTRDANNRISVTATAGNLNQLQGVRINIGSTIWVLTYAGTIGGVETYISAARSGAPWTTAAVTTTNAHFTALGGIILHTTTTSQWQLIQSFAPGHYPHFDDTGLTAADDSSLLIRFGNRWINGEIVGATQTANGDISIDARIAEELPLPLKILTADYEAGGWTNSTTALVNYSNASYANWAAMPANFRTAFARSRQWTLPNQDNWYGYVLLLSSESSQLTQRRWVGDDNADAGEEVVQTAASSTWTAIGTATHNGQTYNVYRLALGAIGSESTGGFGGLIDDYHYRVQEDHPSRWNLEVPYADIANPPPTLFGARRIAGISADDTCTVAEMTVSGTNRLIQLPTWATGERYLCFGVEEGRAGAWFRLEDREGSGNIFDEYLNHADLTVGNILYDVLVSDGGVQQSYSGRTFLLE